MTMGAPGVLKDSEGNTDQENEGSGAEREAASSMWAACGQVGLAAAGTVRGKRRLWRPVGARTASSLVGDLLVSPSSLSDL